MFSFFRPRSFIEKATKLSSSWSVNSILSTFIFLCFSMWWDKYVRSTGAGYRGIGQLGWDSTQGGRFWSALKGRYFKLVPVRGRYQATNIQSCNLMIFPAFCTEESKCKRLSHRCSQAQSVAIFEIVQLISEPGHSTSWIPENESSPPQLSSSFHRWLSIENRRANPIWISDA